MDATDAGSQVKPRVAIFDMRQSRSRKECSRIVSDCDAIVLVIVLLSLLSE